MTGYELKQRLMNSDNDGRCFIKWWRKENDFADYALIDQFLQHLTPESNFENYELLSMDDMWKELKRRAPTKVWMEKQKGEPMLHWKHHGSDGRLREDSYRYSAKVLMALFDQETHGDTLC
jgi:hypothetical protein